jgi:hypothetical protein
MQKCISKNGDKADPGAFCAAIHKKITGGWPSEKHSMPDAAYEVYMSAYTSKLPVEFAEATIEVEKAARDHALSELSELGWSKTSQGWLKKFAAPKMKTIASMFVFESGTHIDNKGQEAKWTDEELGQMVSNFKAGRCGKVPIKLGHSTDSFNKVAAEKLGVPLELIIGEKGEGAALLGEMSTLELKGSTLYAAFERVPETLADLIESRMYNAVSAEIAGKGSEYGPMITGVALLGDQDPAVKNDILATASVFAKSEDRSFLIFAVEPGESTLERLVNRIWSKFAKKLEKSGDPNTNLEKETKLAINAIKGAKIAEFPAKFAIENGELVSIATALGLTDQATIEEILAAITEIKAKMDATMPMGGGQAPMPMAQRFSKASDEILAARKSKRVIEYMKDTAMFTSIPGTSEELATRIVDIEISMGKPAAETELATLKKFNEAAAETLKFKGTNKEGKNTVDFRAKVKELMTTEKIDDGEATKRAMTAYPTLYYAHLTEQKEVVIDQKK